MVSFLKEFARVFFGEYVRRWGAEFFGLCAVFAHVFGAPGVTYEYATVGAALVGVAFLAKFQTALCQASAHYLARKRVQRKLSALCKEEKDVLRRFMKEPAPQFCHILTWPVQSLLDAGVLCVVQWRDDAGVSWRNVVLEFSAVMRDILYDDVKFAELLRKVGACDVGAHGKING